MTVYLILATISLAGGILAGLVRFGIRVFRWCRKLTALVDATHTRTAELEADHGQSVRDRVEAIHDTVSQLQSDLVAHGEQIRELREERRRFW
jgi:hypothetical protein